MSEKITYEKFKETVESLDFEEREEAIIFLLKDIKDLLESICDWEKIEKKHY